MHASPQLLSGYNTEASERVAYDAKDERIRYQEAALGERQEVAGSVKSALSAETDLRRQGLALTGGFLVRLRTGAAGHVRSLSEFGFPAPRPRALVGPHFPSGSWHLGEGPFLMKVDHAISLPAA